MQKWISWALSGLFRYLNAIQTMCPHILRYLTTAVITNKDVRKRRQVLKDLVKVIQQVRTEICCFLFIFFFYWDYNFNVPVLGLLTYFSPNSVTEFFVHCEVKCVLFAGRAKWMKYNVLSVLLFFFPPRMIKAENFSKILGIVLNLILFQPSLQGIVVQVLYKSCLHFRTTEQCALFYVQIHMHFLNVLSQLWEDVAVDRSYKRIKVLDNSS